MYVIETESYDWGNQLNEMQDDILHNQQVVFIYKVCGKLILPHQLTCSSALRIHSLQRSCAHKHENMCASGQDAEDKGCQFPGTRHFFGILDWQQLFWKIRMLWRRWLAAACFGLLTKRKRADVCSKLQPCCCPGFRRQGSFPDSYHDITAPPEHGPSDLCWNNMFLAVTAGNDVLGAVFWEQRQSLAIILILFCHFLHLCVRVPFCSYVLLSCSSFNVFVTVLCKIFHECFCYLYLSKPIMVI